MQRGTQHRLIRKDREKTREITEKVVERLKAKRKEMEEKQEKCRDKLEQQVQQVYDSGGLWTSTDDMTKHISNTKSSKIKQMKAQINIRKDLSAIWKRY